MRNMDQEMIDNVKARLRTTKVPLMLIAREAGVNYSWLVNFPKGMTSGKTPKGSAYLMKIRDWFRQQ